MSDRLIRDAVLAAFDAMNATTTATALVAGGVAILYGRMATPAQLMDCYRDFGAVTIPRLRSAAV